MAKVAKRMETNSQRPDGIIIKMKCRWPPLSVLSNKEQNLLPHYIEQEQEIVKFKC